LLSRLYERKTMKDLSVLYASDHELQRIKNML
jgi:hypothetical protein